MKKRTIEQPDMLVKFKKNSLPTPLKFRIEDREEALITINIDHISYMEKQNRGGEDIYVYQCTSVINGQTVEYLIKYVLSESKWYLFLNDD